MPYYKGEYLTSNSTQSKYHSHVNQHSDVPSAAFGGTSAAGKHMSQINIVDISNNRCRVSYDYLSCCGKPADSQPRRFVHKFGLMVRLGVLKETSSKAKSERVLRSVNV